MIYVVERDGRPVRSRQTGHVLAFEGHDSAGRSAASVGGKVVIYGVGGAVHGEQLARDAAADAERWHAERDAATAELELVTREIARHAEDGDADVHTTLSRVLAKARHLDKMLVILRKCDAMEAKP